MKKLIPAALAALIVLGVSMQTPGTAQNTGPDGLYGITDGAKNALLTGTDKELFNSLAPWLQGRVKLNHAEWVARLEEAAEDDPSFKDDLIADIKQEFRGEDGLDPLNLAGIESFDDLLAVGPEKFFAMTFGFYRLRGAEKLKSRVTTEFFLVDSKSGLVEEDDIMQTRARVKYANARHHDLVVVECVAEGRTWRVTGIKYDINGEQRDFDETPTRLDWLDDERVGSDEMRSEGEQLAGSARDMCRVHFSKTGSTFNRISETGTDFAEFWGEHFRVADEMIGVDATGATIVVVPMGYQDYSDVCFMSFQWMSGETDFRWFDDPAEIDQAFTQITGSSYRDTLEQIAGSFRDQVRVQFAKDGSPPISLDACGLEFTDLMFALCEFSDMIINTDNNATGTITAESSVDGLPHLVYTFNYESGKGEANWYETLDAYWEAIDELEE